MTSPYSPYSRRPMPPAGPPVPQPAPSVTQPWWKRQPASIKAALIGGVVVLVLGCGACGIGALTNSPAKTDQAATTAGYPTASASDTPPASPTAAPAQPSASPVTETRTVTETQTIPHGSRTVNDSSLPKGTTKVRTAGVDGQKTVTYQVTYTDGQETGRTVVSEKVTKQPVTEVVAVGTKTTSSQKCDPNYTPCVPIASDVDCAGGSGNGPAYVQGPVYVIGKDIYGLDNDHDGIGCE